MVPVDFLKVKNPGLGLQQCVGFLSSALGDIFIFLGIHLLQWVFVAVNTRGIPDRECHFCYARKAAWQKKVLKTFFSKDRANVQQISGAVASLHLEAPGSLLHCYWGCVICLTLRTTTWQAMGQNSVFSIVGTDLLVVMMSLAKPYLRVGWWLGAVYLCVFEGLEGGLTCSQTSNTREAAPWVTETMLMN